MHKPLRTFTILLAALTLNGCMAGFSGNKTPATSLNYTSSHTSKKNVYVEIVNFTSIDGSSPRETIFTREENQKIVENSLRKSNLFNGIKFRGIDQEADDLKVQITITEKVSTSGLSGALTIFSLGLIPSSSRTDFILDLKVKSPANSLQEVAKNEDYITQWVGWFVIPWSSNTILDAKTDTLDRQLSDAINRLVASKALTL
ncbi:hypothetical protein ACIPM0_21115 [Pseudomonas sichuanensis]|uniref:hypothetical protein n=1 Tax=Pseudomonas TaxID=286 RepID=UPI003815CB7C